MNSPKALKWLRLLRVCGDLLLFNGAILVAFLLRFNGTLPQNNFGPYLLIAPIISLLLVVIFNFYGLYHTINRSWEEILASLIVSLFWLSMITVVLSYMLAKYSYPRSILAIAPLLQLLLLGYWRWLNGHWESQIAPVQRVIIVAPPPEAELLAAKFNQGTHQVLGVISHGPAPTLKPGIPILGDYSQLELICQNCQPDLVVLSALVPEKYKQLVLENPFKFNWQVLVSPGLYEILLARARLEQIQDTVVLEINPVADSGRDLIKRWLDLIVASLIMVLTSPLLVLIAVAIKLDSAGPVFYHQERVSQHGKRFLLYKFRTMVEDAERETGPVLSSRKDQRITRVGRFLRVLRLDELPQLFNIIKGEMSIVGPRPERPSFVAQFEREIPGYAYRHLLKPGLTGMAQIAGNYSTTAADKLRYDLLYIHGASPLLDLMILLQTIKTILIKGKTS